jgi:preprotein translocase SecE subunit
MARNRQRAKARKQKLHRENIPGSLDHASGEVEEVEAAIVAGAGGEPAEPDGEPVDAGEPDVAVDDAPAAVDVPDADADADADAAGDDDAVDPAEPAPAATRSRRRRGRQPVEPVAADPRERVAELDPDDLDDDDLDDGDQPYAEDSDAAAVEEGRLGKGAGDVAVAPAARTPSGPRVVTFIRACWAELQRVDWPDRRQVGQATAVVLGFVVVAGAFLGLADVVAQKVVDLIL